MSKNELHIPSLYDHGEMPTPTFLQDEEGQHLLNETDASYDAAHGKEPLTPQEEERLFLTSVDMRIRELEIDISKLQDKRLELLKIQRMLEEGQSI